MKCLQTRLGLLYLCSVAAHSSTQEHEHITDFSQLNCHLHDGIEMCSTPTNQTEFELKCYVQNHQTWCFDGFGEEFLRASSSLTSVVSESSGAGTNGTTNTSTTNTSSSDRNCHFHAGVEHCEDHDTAQSCEAVQRDYNIPLRIGAIFTVLVTSGIAVFLPIMLNRWTKANINGLTFILLKQFGTGVIISTALIHLYTHAQLMFSSDCLPSLQYEAVTSAIVMAGILVSFFLEYISFRYCAGRSVNREPRISESGQYESNVEVKQNVSPTIASENTGEMKVEVDRTSVLVMEAGIIFHSIIIGLTTVLAGDSSFTELFIVVVFHQVFEGLALSTRIAEAALSGRAKFLSALTFMLITPVGMAIGMGVLNQFNGNDSKTLIALGTLNAFSAGILLWVGLVELLAKSWLLGELKTAGMVRSLTAGAALVSGLILMSVLGKWA